VADVTLLVGGREYGGWKSARVTRGIESVAGSFELEVSDRWAGQPEPWPITEEEECSLLLEGEVVITGYVDRRRLAYGSEERSLAVRGRDRTGDLVDCSVDLGKWEFGGVPLLILAKRLCEPFGVSVSLQAGLVLPKPPAKFSIDPGESAFEALEKACRLAAVLPVSDGRGGLVLTRTGSSRCSTELVQGQNILAAAGDFDASARFRTYKVLGQHKGDDEFFGSAAATVKATATDPAVRRSARVLVVRPEGNVTSEHAKKRAQWEATVRAARADAVSVTVQGWTQADGSLWPVNAVARVRSPAIGVDGDLVVTQATYSVGLEGTTTELELKRPDAFRPEPEVSKAGGLWKEIARGV
jgi:prophage tail gpP-like protein